MPEIKNVILLVWLACEAGPTLTAVGQQQVIDPSLADQYFRDVHSLCLREGSRLWGISLDGPVLLADEKTHSVVANEADSAGHLVKKGSCFVGMLPKEINIANTALHWAGKKWSMIVWPLPNDKDARGVLMIHEMWHRIQGDLGLSLHNVPCGHLDSHEGRIWLQLEWRALRKALLEIGTARRQAIEDALLFRAYRRSLFEKSDSLENSLELTEGLPEYTGISVALPSDSAKHAYAALKLQEAPGKKSFARSFAYASGPAYGLLLDMFKSDWRKGLGPKSDLGVLLQQALGIEQSGNLEVQAPERSRAYDGDALIKFEAVREEQHLKQLAELRRRFVDEPVLVIPLHQLSYSFDPNNVQSLDTVGTVYPVMRLKDEWGILTVSNGALMNSTFTKVYVTPPAELSVRPLRGDGWTLELSEGWRVHPGERKGDFVLRKIK